MTEGLNVSPPRTEAGWKPLSIEHRVKGYKPLFTTASVEAAAKKHWELYAPVFGLDEDRYEEPDITRLHALTVLGAGYTLKEDELIFPVYGWENMLRHEVRHKIVCDTTKQVLDEAVETGNEDFLEGVARRLRRQHTETFLHDEGYQDIYEDLVRPRENIGNRTRWIAGKIEELRPPPYHEGIIQSFDETGFYSPGKAYLHQIGLPLVFTGIGAHTLYAASKPGFSSVEGAAIGLAGGFLCLAAAGYYPRSQHREKIQMLEDLSPEERRFRGFGPEPEETVNQWLRELESFNAPL